MLVLFDSGENYSDVYKSMFKRTSAIPQKAVIKNGQIRYRAEGYSGSPSQLMDEISTVIELLKEENNN
jgi:cystathionine beta-lyase family protein involved in aluminum resistance